MFILNFIKRHPVFLYFLLTFAISWGGIVWAIGGFSQLTVFTDRFNSLLPLVILAILLGPSLTGLLMVALVNGKVEKTTPEVIFRLFLLSIHGSQLEQVILRDPERSRGNK